MMSEKVKTSGSADIHGTGAPNISKTPSVLPTSTSTSSSGIDSSTVVGQKCNTCGGHFRDAAAYRNHFR